MAFQLIIQSAEERGAERLAEARAAAWLSKGQLCHQLAVREILTDEDAIAAAAGAWPSHPQLAAFLDFLASIDPAMRRDARIDWSGSMYVDRNHYLIESVASVLSLSEATVDEIFGIAPEGEPE